MTESEIKHRAITHPEEDYINKMIVIVWERENEHKLLDWLVKSGIEYAHRGFYYGLPIAIHCDYADNDMVWRKIQELTYNEKNRWSKCVQIGRKFRFCFVGVQTGELGFSRDIRETYDKGYHLGEALYRLHHDYDVKRELVVYEDTSEAYGYMPLIKLNDASVKDIKPIKCDVRREVSPYTGTYKYYRHDNDDPDYWYGKHGREIEYGSRK